MTLSHTYMVAFEGMDAREVDVQVHIAPGLSAFTVVGLADKAVGESSERVRAPFRPLGLRFPPRASWSILRLPIFPKKAAITIFPSRWHCSPP